MKNLLILVSLVVLNCQLPAQVTTKVLHDRYTFEVGGVAEAYIFYVAGNLGIENDELDGNIIIDPEKDLYLNTNDNTRLYIRDDGDIGIGTTNPLDELDIHGIVSLSGVEKRIRFREAGIEKAYFSYSTPTIFLENDDANGIIIIDAQDHLGLYTNDNPRIHIDKPGNVGIGTTSPQDKLDVNGDISLTDGNGAIRFREGTTQKAYMTYDGNHLYIENNESAGDIQIDAVDDIWFNSSDVNRMFIRQDGNVGIGTTTPDQRLDILGDIALTDGSGLIEFKEGTTQKAFLWYTGTHLILENNETAGDIFIDAQDDLVLQTGGTNTMTLLNNGNVGVGTSSPDAKLHVSGDLQIGTYEQLTDGGSTTLDCNSTFRPESDNDWALGSSTRRWTEVWAVDGTINTSDSRDKTNIENLEYGLEEIMKLRPVRYSWKRNSAPKQKIGLLAEEVAKIIDEVVVDYQRMVDEKSGKTSFQSSEILGLFYSDLIPVLIKGMQEQQAQIVERDARIADLEEKVAEMDDLKARLSSLERRLVD